MFSIVSAVSLCLFVQQVVGSCDDQVPLHIKNPPEQVVDFTKVYSHGDPRQSMGQIGMGDSWGLLSFARSKPLRCWGSDADVPYDVAVIGMQHISLMFPDADATMLGAPFDTATSFRPGARFGPNGVRQGARRIGLDKINVALKTRVTEFLDVVDCGDVRELPLIP
jgi:agmatinase